MTDTATETEAKAPPLSLNASRGFAAWLRLAKLSLVFTTYQAGKIFFVGVKEGDRLSVFERSFPRPMGIGVHGGQLWLSALSQLWKFENFLPAGQVVDGFDALFVPVLGYTTGDIDIHDIHGKRPLFVATLFNCLATVDGENSFRPVWKPPFIDRLAAEDRCHLNGLAMEGDRPAYVTCVGTGNIAGSWRERRNDGGVVLDVASGEAVATGLSMPHSPRLYRDRLWLLQAGTGELGEIDRASGKFTPLCFLPGFARGLAFIGNHAVVGLSRPRKDKAFEGLALDARLEKAGASPRCLIGIVNLATGDMEHMLEIGGVVQELYDVAVLPGIKRPKALGFKTDEIRFALRPGPWA